MFMYDDAKVNVLEEALPFLSNHNRKGIEWQKRNLKRKGYDFMDSTKLA
jgi:hypothetical protein